MIYVNRAGIFKVYVIELTFESYQLFNYFCAHVINNNSNSKYNARIIIAIKSSFSGISFDEMSDKVEFTRVATTAGHEEGNNF